MDPRITGLVDIAVGYCRQARGEIRRDQQRDGGPGAPGQAPCSGHGEPSSGVHSIARLAAVHSWAALPATMQERPRRRLRAAPEPESALARAILNS